MRRLYACLLVVLLFPQIAKGQISFSLGDGCLNVVDVAVGKRIGEYGSNALSSRYQHEKFINEQFCFGLGVGFSCIDEYEFSAVPVFVSAHYFFLDQRFSPFVNLRSGVYLTLWPKSVDVPFEYSISSKQPGFSPYLAPSAGLKLHITPYVGLMASLSCDSYLVKTYDTFKNDFCTKMAANWGLSLGICFQIPGW